MRVPAAYDEASTGRVFQFLARSDREAAWRTVCTCDSPAPEACKRTANIMGPLTCDGETTESATGT